MTNREDETFGALVQEGRRLLDESEPVEAHSAFRAWDERVAVWLERQPIGLQGAAQWASRPNSPLVVGSEYRNDPDAWEAFNRAVADRLAWLGSLHGSPASGGSAALPAAWEELLHGTVVHSALPQYRNGHWRDAVLNAFIAVFDLVRSRAALDLDGDRLITRVFSVENPMLIVADLGTESGRNDQVGFMQTLQGVFRGVRSPKAHGLQHDLTALKAAQYMVMASLLARRIEEAHVPENEGTTGATPA